MTSPSSLKAGRNVSCSLLTGFVRTFQTGEFDEIIKTFSLNQKEFLPWAVQADTASSQQVDGVLKTKRQGIKSGQLCVYRCISKSSSASQSGEGTGPPASEGVEGITNLCS